MPLSLVSNSSSPSSLIAEGQLLPGLAESVILELPDVFEVVALALPELFASIIAIPQDLIVVARRSVARRLSETSTSVALDVSFKAVPPTVSPRELQTELAMLDDIALASLLEDLNDISAFRNGRVLEQRFVNYTVVREIEIPCRAGYWVCVPSRHYLLSLAQP